MRASSSVRGDRAAVRRAATRPGQGSSSSWPNPAARSPRFVAPPAHPLAQAQVLQLRDRPRGQAVAAGLVAGEDGRVGEDDVVAGLGGPRRGRGPGGAGADDEDVRTRRGVHALQHAAGSTGQPGSRLRRTRRRGCRCWCRRGTPTARFRVPSARRAPGPTSDGLISAGRTWSRPWPGEPWRWPQRSSAGRSSRSWRSRSVSLPAPVSMTASPAVACGTKTCSSPSSRAGVAEEPLALPGDVTDGLVIAGPDLDLLAAHRLRAYGAAECARIARPGPATTWLYCHWVQAVTTLRWHLEPPPTRGPHHERSRRSRRGHRSRARHRCRARAGAVRTRPPRRPHRRGRRDRHPHRRRPRRPLHRDAPRRARPVGPPRGRPRRRRPRRGQRLGQQRRGALDRPGLAVHRRRGHRHHRDQHARPGARLPRRRRRHAPRRHPQRGVALRAGPDAGRSRSTAPARPRRCPTRRRCTSRWAPRDARSGCGRCARTR